MSEKNLSVFFLLMGLAGLLAYFYEPSSAPPSMTVSVTTVPLASNRVERAPAPVQPPAEVKLTAPVPPVSQTNIATKEVASPAPVGTEGKVSAPEKGDEPHYVASTERLGPPLPPSLPAQPVEILPPPPKHETTTPFHVWSSGTSDSKKIALTFDDGPHPTYTYKVLDALRERNIKATFFVLGQNAKRYPWILRQISAEGHEVGSHAFSHTLLTKLSAEAVEKEISDTQEIVKDATGYEPRLLRPPYGAHGSSVRESIVKHHLDVVLWSVDPRDWRQHDEEKLFNSITNQVRSGSIVLCHDIHLSTVKALPRILDSLLQQGYQFSTVSEVCNLTPAVTNVVSVSAK
ncbi:MAG: polysaccharide deacetylase family protein [Verrucomicrobiae bacterium]|nr:polysaccharide deacetylase family protein [Verrucomicrobiae bacterium]